MSLKAENLPIITWQNKIRLRKLFPEPYLKEVYKDAARA
jgi:hypothetical protein